MQIRHLPLNQYRDTQAGQHYCLDMLIPLKASRHIKCLVKVKYYDSRVAFESEVLQNNIYSKRAKCIYPFELGEFGFISPVFFFFIICS